jgi:hypothetical protein
MGIVIGLGSDGRTQCEADPFEHGIELLEGNSEWGSIADYSGSVAPTNKRQRKRGVASERDDRLSGKDEVVSLCGIAAALR